MTLYTSEVVAQHLDVTERRVRQLRDEGIIREKRPGLYNLVDAMTRYIKYVNILMASGSIPTRKRKSKFGRKSAPAAGQSAFRNTLPAKRTPSVGCKPRWTTQTIAQPR